jgi:type I restriction enzyme, S subunit
MAVKHSGIEWIGDIQSDWEIKKLKYVTRLRNEIGRLYNDNIYLGLENIESSTGKYIQTETEYDDGFYSIVKKGDVLFGKLRPYLEKVYMSDIDGFCSGEFVNFKEFNGEKRYLFYFLLSHGFIEIVNSSTYGAKMPRAEWEYIKNLNIPMPLLSEQNAIATFLDTQCNKIDIIIKELEQQIEILKQYKTSLITETVTKGLNKNVPMKNSGIDWIGKIPTHWEVTKIKFSVSLIGSGTTPASDNNEYYNGEYNWIQSGDLYNVNEITMTEKKISKLAIKTYQILNYYSSDFIVLAMYGASVGNVAISKIDAYSNQACCCIKPDKNTDLRFMYYYFVICKENLIEKAVGGGQPNISQIVIKNEQFLKVPLDEQKAIAAFLEIKCKEITDIITEKQQSIDTMKAYKKSLIYEYVTGKKRVKGYS